MTLALENLILGESDTTLRTESSDDCGAAVITLAAQAQRSLEIFSHTLDRRIYNSQAFYEAALRLASRSRHSRLRIILKDSTDVVKRGSRLVELYHRLSSRVEIRTPPLEYRDVAEEFLLADSTGLLQRKLATRYEGEVCFSDAVRCRQLKKFFDDCWEKSAPDPALRRLHL